MDVEKKEFIGYEYKDVIVKNNYVSIYEDGYENFGWKMENTAHNPQNVGCITMKIKRDRKLKNKLEITKLQRQFDEIIHQIDRLERNKKFLASVVSYSIGLIATVIMALAVFSITYWNNTIAMIVLAIPGLCGWAISYAAYVYIVRNKTQELAPFIDEKYNELYQVTKEASSLI